VKKWKIWLKFAKTVLLKLTIFWFFVSGCYVYVLLAWWPSSYNGVTTERVCVYMLPHISDICHIYATFGIIAARTILKMPLCAENRLSRSDWGRRWRRRKKQFVKLSQRTTRRTTNSPARTGCYLWDCCLFDNLRMTLQYDFLPSYQGFSSQNLWVAKVKGFPTDETIGAQHFSLRSPWN